MERYQDLLNWQFVLWNDFIRIDMEFCKKFRNKIDWGLFKPWLPKEESLLNKVFTPHLNEEIIGGIFEEKRQEILEII